MITTVMAGISVCQIVPIEAEESTYTTSVEEDTGTLQVEASAPDDVLPEDAQLVVSPIVNDGTNSLYEDTLNKLNEQASKDKKVIDAFCAYDIQFEDKDAGVEPDDGFVSVSMKWDTALKPEGVQDDDKVSIIHLTSDDKVENLTDETDTDKNHGTVKMDDNDPEAVTEASIISNSFSVYAFVWQRDDISSVNVHYIDESGNEIADTKTTDITQETGTDTLIQAIDGYTYAYASIDNVNVQSVNIENGRLYFYDGTNWNQASSDDVYLTYTANPTEEVTEPENTPVATEQPEETEASVTPAATPEPEENTEKQLTGSTTDGKYNVTVTYGDDAGLPEGTSLSVKQIDEDNEEYANAKKAVSTATGVDTDDLGMAALDITLLDKDGNKVEPEDNSKVKVSITAEDLPDSVNSVDIHHITENENSSSDTGLLSKITGLFKSNDKDTAETVKKNVTVTNGQAVTDFEVSSFSTFTITWTNSNNTRIGQVNIHYVDENGLEITRTTAISNSDLKKTDGQIVNISDWVKNNDNGSRKVSGYVFQKAALQNIDGTQITGIKVEHDSDNANNYKLYYTTDSDPTESTGVTWTLYIDSVSKKGTNNADIYLVFKSTAQRMLVHYVDEDGKILMNPVYKYADQIYSSYGENGFNIKETDVTKNPWAEAIQNYEFTGRVHMGEDGRGWQGFAFSTVKAEKTGDDTESTNAIYRFEYKLKDDDTSWVNMTGTDVYLIYKKTTKSTKVPVELKYVYSDGTVATDEAGNSLDRTVDAADWTADEWQNLQGYSESLDGYTIDDHSVFVGTEESTLTAQDYTRVSNSGSLPNVTNLGNSISGYGFRYLRYTTDSAGNKVFQVGDGYAPTDTNNGQFPSGNSDDKTVSSQKINRYWTINKDKKFVVYMVYNKRTVSNPEKYTYTVHYIDENGNQLTTAANAQTIDDTHTEINVSSLSTPNAIDSTKYTKQTSALLGRTSEAAGGISFTKINFTKGTDDSGRWTYTVTREDGTTTDARQLVIHNLNIYVVYKANATTPAIPDSKKVTVHFVDTNGHTLKNSSGHDIDAWPSRITLNKNGGGTDNSTTVNFSDWNGYDFTIQNGTGAFSGVNGYLSQITSDYTFVGEYLGPSFNLDSDKLVTTTAPGGSGSGKYVQWKYQDGKWYISHGDSSNAAHNTTDSDVFEGTLNDVTDIYWVYTKKIKVHYVYVTGRVSDTDDDLGLAKINGHDDSTISSIPFSADNAILLNGENSDDDKTNYAPDTIGNYSYAGTRVGPAWSNSLTYADLGANVQSVYFGDGQLTYYGNTTVPLTYLRNNTWYHAENNGRRFELTLDDAGNYTLNDSRHGSLSLDESSTDTTNNAVTYVATYHGESQTTEYKLTYYQNNSSSTRYSLTVSDWMPNDQSDVYEVYADTSKYSLWIEDDQMYTGYLIANKSSTIPSDGTYAWYKTVTNSDGETTTSPVLRKQTGIHYNIEYDPKERTWLDVEADEGGRNSTTQTSVSYYVTYTYTEGNEQKTIQSQSLSIPYYSELKNGSFENVVVPYDDSAKDNVKTTPTSKNPYGRDTGDYSNSDYKANGGVWQTTGIGTGINRYGGNPPSGSGISTDNWRSNTNADIEIVNTKKDLSSSYGFANKDAFKAKDENQFAELNAEAAGALYQDVVTHPNEQLHYWFSHRARGQQPNSTPEYDTMYLVIMPTKLAMTSAKDGGELKTQSDLIDFINAHGGFDYNLATSVSQEITHAEDDDGILIMKISSNDQFWHDVRSINGYVAKAGLTRFFFTAGPTSWSGENGSRSAVESATHGNFLDGVGFSQTFPKTDGFNLSVSKTFTGLSESELVGLAKQVTDANGDTTTNDKAFNISISDQFASETLTDEGALVALNGAQLGFNVSGSAGNYTFTPTATLNGANILTGNSSGTVTTNSDGSITMTWDFLDQSMTDNKGDEATGDDKKFYYTVREDNAGVSGKYLSSSESHYNNSGQTHSGGSQYIHQGDSAVFTLNNTYRETSVSEQPQMIITKTFSGMTPTAVDAMLPGYTLKVQKTSEGAKTDDFITLTSDKANTIKSAEGVTDATTNGSNVTATVEEVANADGTTTLQWIIKGWGTGTYTITEEGYDTSVYKLKTVTVNGDSTNIADTSRTVTVTTTDDNGTQSTTEEKITGKQKTNIAVGTAINLQYDSNSVSQGGDDSGSLNGNAAEQLKVNTNLIFAQYTINGTTKRFFVWTPQSLSANVSKAIVDKINKEWNAGATINNTEFHSSANPGSINVGTGGAGSIAYDSEENSRSLSFTGSDTLTWNRYYSTRYWVGTDGSKDSGKYSDTDIAVKNSYLPAIRVLKVDSNNTTTPLAGAKFKLFKVEDNANKYLKVTGSVLTWNADSTSATELETNDQGFAVHNESGATALEIISQLQPGTYYIEESKAPDGYNQLSHPVAFTVSVDGIVTKPEATNGKVGNVTVDQTKIVGDIDWNSPYYTVTISNTPGFILPITGGKGIALFTMMGMLLIAIAGVLYAKKKVNQNIKNIQ